MHRLQIDLRRSSRPWDVLTFVTSDLKRKLNGFVSHPQRLFLGFPVRDDFRQRRHKDSVSALGLRPQVDGVLQRSIHRPYSDPESVHPLALCDRLPNAKDMRHG
jgi:hypothetical protein